MSAAESADVGCPDLAALVVNLDASVFSAYVADVGQIRAV